MSTYSSIQSLVILGLIFRVISKNQFVTRWRRQRRDLDDCNRKRYHCSVSPKNWSLKYCIWFKRIVNIIVSLNRTSNVSNLTETTSKPELWRCGVRSDWTSGCEWWQMGVSFAPYGPPGMIWWRDRRVESACCQYPLSWDPGSENGLCLGLGHRSGVTLSKTLLGLTGSSFLRTASDVGSTLQAISLPDATRRTVRSCMSANATASTDALWRTSWSSNVWRMKLGSTLNSRWLSWRPGWRVVGMGATSTSPTASFRSTESSPPENQTADKPHTSAVWSLYGTQHKHV